MTLHRYHVTVPQTTARIALDRNIAQEQKPVAAQLCIQLKQLPEDISPLSDWYTDAYESPRTPQKVNPEMQRHIDGTKKPRHANTPANVLHDV